MARTKAQKTKRTTPPRKSRAPQRRTPKGRGRPLAARGMGRGGRRLAEAFAAVEGLPALAESRGRLERALSKSGASLDEIAEAVESDAALAIAVLRAASSVNGSPPRLGGVPDAIETLTPVGVGAAADSVQTYEFFESAGPWQVEPERFRRHSVATRHAAERIAELVRLPNPDEIALAALLHDVGRLVLMQLYPGYGDLLAAGATPEQRLQAERRELGVDHALVGGVLVRRWGLAPGIGAAIERHHADDATGAAAAIGLADLIAHHSQGEAISPERLSVLGSSCELAPERVRSLLYEFPYVSRTRRRSSEPCPLSGRELDALRGLADGKVYKEIAEELSLSASTVRTHLHNVYRKIGALDRAQAVLIATDRGWI
jgi:putative nucleotidyltransferase with HDIG domain